jgi:hypothetical protein
MSRMKSIAALLAIGLLGASALVFLGTRMAPPTGQHTEVFLHCGLKQAGVEFEGQHWKFVTDDPSANPPWFAMDSQWVTFTIARRGDQVLAYGPWFTMHRLVPPEEGDIIGGCL